MKIDLTEQQARTVVFMARQALELEALRPPSSKTMNPGDTAAAYSAVTVLDHAWKKSVGELNG